MRFIFLAVIILLVYVLSKINNNPQNTSVRRSIVMKYYWYIRLSIQWDPFCLLFAFDVIYRNF